MAYVKTSTMWRAAAVGVTTMGLAGLGSGAAWAGGIGVIGSPAFDNYCQNVSQVSRAVDAAVEDAGLAAGNSAQAPIQVPRNQCGGADLIPEGGLLAAVIG